MLIAMLAPCIISILTAGSSELHTKKSQKNPVRSLILTRTIKATGNKWGAKMSYALWTRMIHCTNSQKECHLTVDEADHCRLHCRMRYHPASDVSFGNLYEGLRNSFMSLKRIILSKALSWRKQNHNTKLLRRACCMNHPSGKVSLLHNTILVGKFYFRTLLVIYLLFLHAFPWCSQKSRVVRSHFHNHSTTPCLSCDCFCLTA